MLFGPSHPTLGLHGEHVVLPGQLPNCVSSSALAKEVTTDTWVVALQMNSGVLHRGAEALVGPEHVQGKQFPAMVGDTEG
jgi:hypothetical protein